MRFYIFNIVVLILFVGSSIAQDSLNLNLINSKSTFYIGEIIDVGIEITNTSKSTINFDQYKSLEIRVTDGNNNELKNIQIDDRNVYLWFNKNILKPLESDYKIINLNENYGDHIFNGFPIRYFNPGKYNIEIISKVSSIYPMSQTLTFQVVEPTGNELLFLNKFQQIISMRTIPNYSNEGFIDQLQVLHETYPQSIYSPIIVDILHAILFVGSKADKKKALFYEDEAVEKYPWSSLARGKISVKTKSISYPSDRIKYLKKLLPLSVNSPMKKYIEKLIHTESQK
jgi:hypothetical protein